ncbi:MAG: hypothetical protein EP338_08115 [Bacteroidetes bacterium]|nr:MAG: hypothetical protein EP338_08115 [Bacteroidota bacterium]
MSGTKNMVNPWKIIKLSLIVSLMWLSTTMESSLLAAGTIVSIQDFESPAGTPTMTFTSSGGATITGSTGTGDRPASSPYFTSGTTAWAVRNGTSVLTFSNNSSLGLCTDKYFQFDLAAWSISSTGNGMDAADVVTVEISLDGGSTWSREATIQGNSNANWNYSASGSATVTYDGDNSPTNFQPAGGGTRTTDGYSKVRIDLPNSCTQARIRITMLNNSSGERWSIDDVELIATCTASCSPATQPTTNASGISVSPGCSSAQINFTGGNGANAIILMSTSCPISGTPTDQNAYSSSATFGAGATIGAGNYVVYNGAAGSTIVTGLSPGTTYCFKIFEYNGAIPNCEENYLTSGVTTTTFTTSTSCASPEIRSILVNACTVSEGFDELVIFENGASALDIDDISIDFPNGGTFCNSGCSSKTLTNNATYINSLNTLAGCTLFQYANPIPAGAIVYVFTGLNPTMTFDFSSECPGGGPYYVIFANNTTDSGGRFANNAGATRTLSIDFGSSTDNVTYTSNSSNTGTDGDYVSFDNGGTPSYGNFANCAVVLPVEWGYFNIEPKGNSAWINWSTLSERENDYFVIEYVTEPGVPFKQLGKVKSQGVSSTEQHYSFFAEDLPEALCYFKIKQVDMNGEYSFSDIAVAEISSMDMQPVKVDVLSDQTTIRFNHEIKRNSTVRITDLAGKLLYNEVYYQGSKEIKLDGEVNGLMLISIEHPMQEPKFFKLIAPKYKR